MLRLTLAQRYFRQEGWFDLGGDVVICPPSKVSRRGTPENEPPRLATLSAQPCCAFSFSFGRISS